MCDFHKEVTFKAIFYLHQQFMFLRVNCLTICLFVFSFVFFFCVCGCVWGGDYMESSVLLSLSASCCISVIHITYEEIQPSTYQKQPVE